MRVIGVLLALAGGVCADLITFEFSGTVVGVYDPDSNLDESVTRGVSFSGSYTFSSESPNTGVPTVGVYLQPVHGGGGISAVVGDCDPRRISVRK